jgi:hypothetical protein
MITKGGNCISRMRKILGVDMCRIVKNCKVEVEPTAEQWSEFRPKASLRGLGPRSHSFETRLISRYKNEIALLSTEADSSAISESYKPPKRFIRWQPDLVRPDCQFVFRQAIGGRRSPVSTRSASVNLATLAGHKTCFRESHIPCGTWCH